MLVIYIDNDPFGGLEGGLNGRTVSVTDLLDLVTFGSNAARSFTGKSWQHWAVFRLDHLKDIAYSC